MNLICYRCLLAIVLTLGCSLQLHAEQDADEMSDSLVMVRPVNAQAVSLDDIVKSMDAPGATKPLGLCYLDQQGDWLLTYHDGQTELFGRSQYHSRTAICRKAEDGYRLEAEWFSGIVAHLEKPRFFHTFINNKYTHLLWVPGRVYGTGSFREDAVFHLPSKGAMKLVAFEPAPIGYMRLHKAGVAEAVMHDGEGGWTGRIRLLRVRRGCGSRSIRLSVWCLISLEQTRCGDGLFDGFRVLLIQVLQCGEGGVPVFFAVVDFDRFLSGFDVATIEGFAK